MTGAALAAIQNALRVWVLAGSGLNDANVEWQNGGAPRPTDPFIALQHDIQPYAVDYVRYTRDPASNGHDGHELIATVYGDRKVKFTLQAFALDADDLSNVAVSLLERVVTAQALPSVRAALRAANIGVSAFGPIQPIGGRVVNLTTFEPRAVLEVSLWVTSTASEPATCIDTVSAGVAVASAGESDSTFTVTA